MDCQKLFVFSQLGMKWSQKWICDVNGGCLLLHLTKKNNPFQQSIQNKILPRKTDEKVVKNKAQCTVSLRLWIEAGCGCSFNDCWLSWLHFHQELKASASHWPHDLWRFQGLGYLQSWPSFFTRAWSASQANRVLERSNHELFLWGACLLAFGHLLRVFDPIQQFSTWFRLIRRAVEEEEQCIF